MCNMPNKRRLLLFGCPYCHFPEQQLERLRMGARMVTCNGWSSETQVEVV